MKLSNKEMDAYLSALGQISERATGRLGYAVARNMRKISEELVEFQNLKDKTINKYGTVGDNGVASIQVGSEAYAQYMKTMEEYMDICHDVQLFYVTENEIINSDLNAKEMLSIDFMVKKEDDNE